MVVWLVVCFNGLSVVVFFYEGITYLLIRQVTLDGHKEDLLGQTLHVGHTKKHQLLIMT